MVFFELVRNIELLLPIRNCVNGMLNSRNAGTKYQKPKDTLRARVVEVVDDELRRLFTHPSEEYPLPLDRQLEGWLMASVLGWEGAGSTSSRPLTVYNGTTDVRLKVLNFLICHGGGRSSSSDVGCRLVI